MKPELVSFLDSLLVDQVNPDEYFARFVQLAHALGVDHINLGLTAPRSDGTADVKLWSTMNDGWISEYNECYLANDDYVVRTMMPGFEIPGSEIQRLTWHGDILSRSRDVRKPTQRVLAGAGENGMVQAVSYALAGLPARANPAASRYSGLMVSFGRDAGRSVDSFDNQVVAQEDLLLTALFALMPRLLQFEGADDSPTQQLSTRERDVLLYLSKGQRPDAIADALGIARVTVDLHIKNARTKLGARTPAEAVAVALRTKLIE